MKKRVQTVFRRVTAMAFCALSAVLLCSAMFASVAFADTETTVVLHSGETLYLEDGTQSAISVRAEATADNPAKIVSGGEYGAVFSEGTLIVSGTGLTVSGAAFTGGGASLDGAASVSFEECTFYGCGVFASDSSELVFTNCDFSGGGVGLTGVTGASFSGCCFSDGGITASGTDFRYLASGGLYGEINGCFFYGGDTALSLYGCSDLNVRGGQIYGFDTGILLDGTGSFSMSGSCVFGCGRALAAKAGCGTVTNCLFYSNGFCAAADGGGNSLRLVSCVSVGIDAVAAAPGEGITSLGCVRLEESEYKSRFSFNLDGADEGFTNIMGVRVAVEDGCYCFEPDTDYIFLTRQGIYLNQYLCGKILLGFAENTPLYGELNRKPSGDSPWIFGSDLNEELQGGEADYYSVPMKLAVPLQSIQLKLSLTGRCRLDYISFAPDVTVSARLVSANTVRLTLGGSSGAVFAENPAGITVSGTDVSYGTVCRGGRTVDLVFERPVKNVYKKLTVTVSPESLVKPFADMLSGYDLLGRSAEAEAELFGLSKAQEYPTAVISSGVTAPSADLTAILINIAVAGIAVLAVGGAVTFAVLWLIRRNGIKKFARKGRKAIKRRRSAGKF